MKQPGRKSAASLSVLAAAPRSRSALARPPAGLDAAATALWRAIVDAYPPGWFAPGDLVLLREFVITAETLLPAANAAAARGGAHEHSMRTMHVKTLAMLASKLRLNVSARTRSDTASTRDAARPAGRVDFRNIGEGE